MFKAFSAAVLAVLFISLGALAARAEAPITFTVIRKGDDIGTHTITFEKKGDTLKVDIKTRIAVKVLFVTAYKFSFDGTETWKDGKLVALDDHTNDNGEKHAVTVEKKDGKLILTADGNPQEISPDTIPGSWWNIKLTGRKELLDVLTGKIVPVTIKKIGSEKVKAGGADMTADHYEVSGGLQRNLWYKPNGTLVRQTVLKKGDVIEYAVK
jgi:hypothetical protein